MKNQIFIRYRRKQDFCVCPLCGKGVKWATDGIEWYPCNEEPILFVRDSGFEMVLKRGEVIRNTKVLRAGMKAKNPADYEYGLEPHIFTCEKLKKGSIRNG